MRVAAVVSPEDRPKQGDCVRILWPRQEKWFKGVVTAAYPDGRPVPEIQVQLRHSDAKSLRTYLDVSSA